MCLPAACASLDLFRLARRVRGARFVVNVVLLLLAVALRRFFEVQHAAAGCLSAESPLTRSQSRRARATLHSAVAQLRVLLYCTQ